MTDFKYLVFYARLRALKQSAIAFLLLTAVVAGQTAQSAVTVVIDPAFERHGLQVLSYGSAGFQEALTQILGSGAASSLGPLQPYTVIVRNPTPTPLAKVVVRYPRRNASDRTIDGTITTTVGDSASGSALVLTPDNRINQAFNSNGSIQITGQAVTGFVGSTIGSKFDPVRFPQATVSLDLVIFADGGVVGPDQAGVVGLEKAKSEVENAMLARLQDTSITDDDIGTWLNGLSAAEAPVDANKHPDLVEGYRIVLAKAILQFMGGGQGRTATALWLQDALAKRRPSGAMLYRLD